MYPALAGHLFLHAHHKAMEGSSSRETHFRLVITSSEFQSKRQPARHRLVYGLLKEEKVLVWCGWKNRAGSRRLVVWLRTFSLITSSSGLCDDDDAMVVENGRRLALATAKAVLRSICGGRPCQCVWVAYGSGFSVKLRLSDGAVSRLSRSYA